MTEFDERQMDQWLREAVGARPVRFDAEAWRRRYAEDLAELGSVQGAASNEDVNKQTKTFINSIRRLSLFTRLAAVAAALAIVVAGGLWLAGGNGGSSRLFAQTLQHIQQRSYGFTLEVWVDDALEGAAEAMVAEPGRIRFDQTGGVGPLSTIVDARTDQTAVLFHRQKASYLFEKDSDVAVESRPLAFLVLPGRSILDLWLLHAGDERALGRRVIDGREVEGFEVMRDTAAGPETITVWADADTGMPQSVNVELPPDDTRSLPAMTLRLQNFNLSVDPDPHLFALRPEGYTPANQLGLADLMQQKRMDAGSDFAGADTDETLAARTTGRQTLGLRGAEGSDLNRSLKAERAAELAPEQQVIEMFQKVETEQYDAAIVRMRAIDWKEPMTFEDKPLVLVLSETDAIALTAADRQQVVGQAMITLKHLRTMARQAIDRAAKHRDAGRVDEAEALLAALADFARFLHDNEERMLIVRLAGIAIEQLVLPERSALCRDAGREEECEHAEARRAELDLARDRIREGIRE